MALRPRQLADEIEATLEGGRFSTLRKIYEDMYEPQARAAYAADALLDGADALPSQWEAQLAKVEEELAIELKREAGIKSDRERRVQQYQAELLKLDAMVEQTEERARVEAEVLALRAENSRRSAQLLDAARTGGVSEEERRQQAALRFAQHLPLEVEKARVRCRTPARAWRSIGLLCCAIPEEPFVPLVAQFPAIEGYFDAGPATEKEISS